jgi:hypothetical protein
VQMNNGAAVGRPFEFDSFALLHLDGLHIADNAPIFDAEIKATRFDGCGLSQTIAGTSDGYRRRSDSNAYQFCSYVTTVHAPPRV